jgi:hypothetical protein
VAVAGDDVLAVHDAREKIASAYTYKEFFMHPLAAEYWEGNVD